MIAIIGWIFGIIAGPAINIIFVAAIAFVVEKGLEPVEAVKRGYTCFMTNPGIHWVYGLIVGILSGVGAIACGIGVILTFPLGTVGMTVAYQELSVKLDNPPSAGTSTSA